MGRKKLNYPKFPIYQEIDRLNDEIKRMKKFVSERKRASKDSILEFCNDSLVGKVFRIKHLYHTYTYFRITEISNVSYIKEHKCLIDIETEFFNIHETLLMPPDKKYKWGRDFGKATGISGHCLSNGQLEKTIIGKDKVSGKIEIIDDFDFNKYYQTFKKLME